MDLREKIEQLRIQLELATASQNQKLSSESIVVLSQSLDKLIVEEIKRVNGYTLRSSTHYGVYSD